MEHAFWHQKWEANEIGFHMGEPNPVLVKHIGALSLAKGSRIFLPLCGKTLDIGWLLSQGYSAVGCELSQLAVDQLFEQLQVTPQLSQIDDLVCYEADRIQIFQGDFFQLDQTMLGKVDGVYDRAALVALPLEMREQYSKHLVEITKGAAQLLVSFEYDQSQMQGPPFSVTGDEINRWYAGDYEIELLQQQVIEGGLKGLCVADEFVYHLKPC